MEWWSGGAVIGQAILAARAKITKLTIRAPEGNGCAERFIRTLKETVLWIRIFRTAEGLRLALIDFRQTNNELG